MTTTNDCSVRRFSTGAVRSKDADATRYDLITPIGLNELARIYARPGIKVSEPDTRDMVGAALDQVYHFLSGDGSVYNLSCAAEATAELIAIEAGEDRDWIEDLDEFDTSDGLLPFERIPISFLTASAEAYAEGAIKYSAFNWEKGMSATDILNHFIRHLLRYRSGDRTEPHLGHAGWNILAAIHSVIAWPELNEATLRRPGCKPPAAALGGNAAEPEPEPEHVTDEGVSFAEMIEFFSKGTVKSFPRIFTEPKPAHRIPAVADFVSHRAPPPVLYISGPMSGIDDYNFPAFNAAADRLRAKGYPVLNPADFGAKETSWAKNLERDLSVLCHAEILVRLPGWELSKGASLENSTAVGLGKGVVDIAELLDIP